MKLLCLPAQNGPQSPFALLRGYSTFCHRTGPALFIAFRRTRTCKMAVVEAETSPARSRWTLTAEDLAWLAVFTLLAVCQEDVDYQASIMLLLLAIFQVLEPKLSYFQTPKGHIVGPLIKMVLCYGLVGWAHAINSSFYPIFLLPIISAATVLDLGGTVAFIVLACLAYASFLLYVDWEQVYIAPAQIRLLCLRLFFFPLVGLAVYQQARAKRLETARTKAAADQLAESNRTLRRTEASLRRSERLAALGQLTAGLAHELRNPLGTIKASSEMLSKPATHSNRDVVEELAGYISSEVDRTNTLVSQFLDFARPLQLNPKQGDLRDALVQSEAQARPRAESKGVQISTKAPGRPIQITFDSALLTVALTNLLQNAIDAVDPEGRVEIELEDLTDGARISVTDNGSGISPQHLESIFNPFFTTKNNGTGLGLALVSKIVDEHHGKISVHSNPGEGARFEILLPHSVNV